MSGCGTSNPNPYNFCSNAIGEEYDIPNSCQFVGGGGNINCPVSSPGEWTDGGVSSTTCTTATFHNGNELPDGLGCESIGCCKVIGRRKKCIRNQFKGNETACAFRSIVGGTFKAKNADVRCFADDQRYRTCAPEVRGPTGLDSLNVAGDWCSNDKIATLNNPDPLVDPIAFTNSIVDDTYQQWIFSDGPEGNYKTKWQGDLANSECQIAMDVNNSSLVRYREILEPTARRFFIEDESPILDNTNPNFDPFLDTMISLCKAYPGACDEVLTQRCSTVTKDQLQESEYLTRVCGCFMPDNQYGSLGNLGVKRECEPTCVLESTIKQGDRDGRAIECTDTLCIINDVSLSILDNSSTGNISFSQLCKSCGDSNNGGSCRCILDNITIDAVQSKVGDVNFSEACGGQPLCYQTSEDETIPPKQVDCTTNQHINTGGPITDNVAKPTNNHVTGPQPANTESGTHVDPTQAFSNTSDTAGHTSIAVIIIIVIVVVIIIIAVVFFLRGRSKASGQNVSMVNMSAL